MKKTSKYISLAIILLLSYTSDHARSLNTEKSSIKENMEFAAKQYNLMMKTPAQGKEERHNCLTAGARMAQFLNYCRYCVQDISCQKYL